MSISAGHRSIYRAVWRQTRTARIHHFSSSCRHLQADPLDPVEAPDEPPSGPKIRRVRKRDFNQPKQFDTRDFSIQNAVSLYIDGSKYLVSTILLRDLCTCPQCLDPSTKQKHLSTADIPENIRTISKTIGGGKFTFLWDHDVPGYGEDHMTVISKDLLKRVLGLERTTAATEPIPRSLWDNQMFESAATDFSYDEYMQDDTILLKALRQLHTHGLLFVKGVPEDEKSVEAVAERIGPLKNTLYGRTWDVKSVPDAINVAYTSQNLGFHSDLMYLEQPPHLQLLHCIRSSAAGGASLFTDSFRAVSDLNKEHPDAYKTLSVTNVPFHYDHPGKHYYHQSRPVIQLKMIKMGNLREVSYAFMQKLAARDDKRFGPDIDPMDCLDSVAWSPPFQGPFSVGAKVSGLTKLYFSSSFNQWHSAAAQFNRLIHRPEMIHQRLMRPGEMVIFDNRRVLHARSAFEVGDKGKERWLKGAYVDRDPYLSRLRVLRRLLEKGERRVKEEKGEGREEKGEEVERNLFAELAEAKG